MQALRALMLCLALVTGGVALAQKVQTDYDHQFDFSQVHSYSWHKVKAGNSLWEQRIMDAVDKDLQVKGWQKTPAGGQVMLTAIGATQNQREYQTFYDGLPGWGWRGFGRSSTTTVENYRTGTLVLDIYDTTSKHLLWRGTASDVLASNPEKNIKKLDKSIDKMLGKFPPKGTSRNS